MTQSNPSPGNKPPNAKAGKMQTDENNPRSYNTASSRQNKDQNTTKGPRCGANQKRTWGKKAKTPNQKLKDRHAEKRLTGVESRPTQPQRPQFTAKAQNQTSLNLSKNRAPRPLSSQNHTPSDSSRKRWGGRIPKPTGIDTPRTKPCK